MNNLKFFAQRLGNAYIVGLGGCELAKFWFKADGDSNSVLSEEKAKEMADGLRDYFEEKYDTSSMDEEEWGGSSEKNQMLLKMYDEMARIVK